MASYKKAVQAHEEYVLDHVESRKWHYRVKERVKEILVWIAAVLIFAIAAIIFIAKHFLERVCGQKFTHEEAERVQTKDLAPCPFCGGTADYGPYFIKCQCGARITGNSREDCKSKWERRTK